MSDKQKDGGPFTDSQIRNWRAYEKIRKGGRFNMFDPRARRETGLGKVEYSFTLHNYSALKVAASAKS